MMIGRVKPNYSSSFEYRGYMVDVHRPVTAEYEKLDVGWQFSLKGVPLCSVPLEPKLKAINHFRQTLDKFAPNDTDLAGMINRTLSDNRAVWNLS